MKRTLIMMMAVIVAVVAMAGTGINPQFLKWQKMKAAGLLPEQRKAAKVQVPQSKRMQIKAATLKSNALQSEASASTFNPVGGLAPEVTSFDYLADQVGAPFWKPVDGYPAKFDLRDYGNVTGVRNQGDFETCWAFVSFASLESSILVQRPTDATYTPNDIDFSERHLVDQHGFDLGPKDRGSMLMTMAYLLRWGGPVSESSSPYPSASTKIWPAASGATIEPRLHVQQVRWLPGRLSSTDNDAIKEAVLNYGAVYATFRWDDFYYTIATSAIPTITRIQWAACFSPTIMVSSSSDGTMISQ